MTPFATRVRVLVGAGVLGLLATLLPLAPPVGAVDGGVPLSAGSNQYGQLGDASSGGRSTPGPVDVAGVVAIASGRDHGYALDAAGSLWGWGDNGFGQVGDGTTTDRRTPVKLGLSGVVAVEAGHYQGIAIRSDGTVWTWGYGSLGQLGLGTTNNRTVPTQVPGLTGIVQVAIGRDAGYAVRSDGSVMAWGSNAFGEVGDGTTTRRTSPVVVPGVSAVVEISAGRNHVLARTSTGAVLAWGDNQFGQLGDGTATTRLGAVPVSAGAVAHVDAGAHHSIAVRTDGTVLTWGRGYRGQLGLGSTANRATPTVVPGLPASVEIGDGRDQSFAITGSGDVWAWGQNSSGQLGDGTTTVRTAPVKLPVSGVAAAQSGSSHTIFLPNPSAPPPVNVAPVARLSVSCDLTECIADGSGSTDQDGTTVDHTWDFGDGSSGSGVSVSHRYSSAGTYTVRLTVTDDHGATGTAQQQVTVSSGPPPTSQVAFRASASGSANAPAASVRIPADVVEGDVMLLFATTNVAGAQAGPPGWTLVADRVHSYRDDMRTRLYSRVASAGDANTTATVSLAGFVKTDLSLVAYSGVDTAAPIRAWAAAEEESTVSTHATPGLNGVAGSWVVSYWGEKTSSTTDWSPPVGQTVRAESIGSGGGRIVSLTADSAGPVGESVWSGSAATANSAGRKAIMFSVALRPLD